MLLAINDAREGRRVIYEAESMQMCQVRLNDLEVLVKDGGVLPKKIRRTNGQYHMVFDTGGWIALTSPARDSRHIRRLGCDTHLLDNVMIDSHPEATRVVRAVLQ